MEGREFLLRVVADLLVDVEAEGEEIEEHLVGHFLRELDGDFEEDGKDGLRDQEL